MNKLFTILLLLPTLVSASEYLVPINNDGYQLYSMPYKTVCAGDSCYYVVDRETAESLVDSGAADSYEESVPRYLYATNDEHFSEQWALRSSGINWQGGEALMSSATGSPVAAIIDSGIVRHNDLDESAIYDKLSVFNITPTDMEGHGTVVAGIIAATNNNAFGIAGVNYGKGRILPIKATRDAANTFNSIDVIEAIGFVLNQYANGAPIVAVNMSFGGGRASEAEFRAFSALKEAGIIVVAAAGNDMADMDNPSTRSYPAEYNLDNIITVAALSEELNLSSYSNYGGTTAIAAPGDRILSLDHINNGFVISSGTSMAAPFVTGVLLAGQALNPTLTAAQLMNILYDSADNTLELKNYVKQGRRINVGAFLEQVNQCRYGCAVSSVFPDKGGYDLLPPPDREESSSSDSGWGCSMTGTGGGRWDLVWLIVPIMIVLRRSYKRTY
ncbi:MAG: S8 family serine peptidase [Deferribacteraceae bacterium]|nr:S8 family serine peptidase [Deferribacteraceae bacterium]